MEPPEQWTVVDRYLTDRLVPSDPVLDAALADSEAAGLPPIHVAPNQGKMLTLLARITGARRILEIGTLGGYSTLWLARGLPADGSGRIVTLEFEERHAAVARANFARAGVTPLVEIRLGPALETLGLLAAEGGPAFDLIFIDADKENYAGYLEGSLRLARPGGLIVADNVVRRGQVADPACDESRVQGARRFLEALAEAERAGRLTATAVQTVGSKGYDGFALAVVAAAADPCAAVEQLTRVREAMMVDAGAPGQVGVRLLFVVLRPGAELDDKLRAEINARFSGQRAPDAVYAVPALPRTSDGRKHTAAVERIFAGGSEAMANPEALRPFVDLFNNL